MRRLYAWGVVAWAIGWVFLPPHVDPSVRTYWWMAGAGTLLLVAAGWGRPLGFRWSWSTIIAVAGLALFGWWWFDTIFIGPLLLATGALLMIVLGRNRWGGQLGDGLITAGTVATLQLIGYYLFIVYIGPRGHGAAIPANILAALFGLCGVKAAALPHGLNLLSTDRLFQIVPSPNNMGVFVFLQVYLGLVALAITGKMKARHLITGAFVVTLFAFVRFAAIMIWDYVREGMFDTYWSAKIFAWTVWPLALCLQRLPHAPDAKLPRGELLPRPRMRTARFITAIVATLIAVFAWTSFEGYHAPGKKMQGRILMDELHSDWEWSEMPFDTIWYGQQSTYNFYCLAEFWDKYFHLDRGHDTLTTELLSNYDVLVLKVPTQPYAPSEVDAVIDFVKKGGGLVLIGEHTNVFGYATFLNPVATKMGQRFTANIIYDLKTGDLNLYKPPTLLPHPIVQNMPIMLWGGPCSVWGDLGARSAVTGFELKALPADYTQRNFFPERIGHTGYQYGMFTLLQTTRLGKGRIVTFCDSTIWSNFFVFLPGKVELALSMVDYVNRSEVFPYWRILMFLLAVVSLFVAAVSTAGMRLEGWIWMAMIGFLTFGGAVKLIQNVNHRNYPLPTPHTPFPELNFEGEHSQYFLPEHRLARQADKDFSTFYLWTQRVGIVPRKFPTLEEALTYPGGQIIIDPVKPFTDDELNALRRFVENGGTLYVFDGPHNHQSSANQVLKRFGMVFDMHLLREPPGEFQKIADVLWQNGGQVSGGQPILTGPNGAMSCALKKVGKGQVVAFANSNVFERKTMGYTAMIPNAIQGTISRFEYQLMEYLNYPPEEMAVDSATTN